MADSAVISVYGGAGISFLYQEGGGVSGVGESRTAVSVTFRAGASCVCVCMCVNVYWKSLSNPNFELDNGHGNGLPG